MNYEAHPAAMLFPMMGEGELAKLAEDIKANGLLDGIVVHDGMILDGRNRHAACVLVGVEPLFHTPEPPISDPYTYVLSKNLKRRHLDSETRAWIAAMSMPQLMEEAKKRQGARNDLAATSVPDGTKVGRATVVAAEVADVSRNTIQRAWEVTKADPELAEVARKNKVPPTRAHRALSNPELREELLAGKSGRKPSSSENRRPKAERVEAIRKLVAEGYHDTQIAKRLGISVDRVANLANEAGIQLTHSLIGRTKAIDINRVLEETVMSASGIASTLTLLDGREDGVDKHLISGWLESLVESSRLLGKLIRKLKELQK